LERIMPARIAIILALLVSAPAFAQSAPDWSKAETVEIVLSSYAFTPSTLNLRVGKPYHLVFASSVTKDHNFAAPELFQSGIIADADKAKVSRDGEVEVDDGGTVTVDFVPGKAGTYPFDCTHFMHATLGMKGTAVVQ
jgi:plastocyanin